MIYIHDEDSGLWFEWNESHTVNVQRSPLAQDIDCYSIGDFAKDSATYEEFVESVKEYIQSL